jgi:hypothetical protein
MVIAVIYKASRKLLSQTPNNLKSNGTYQNDNGQNYKYMLNSL